MAPAARAAWRRRVRRSAPAVVLCASLAGTGAVSAEPTTTDASSSDEIARKLADPAAPIVSIPFQYNYLAEAGPGGDDTNHLLKIQPVIPFVGERGKFLLRPILPVLWNEFPERASGFGDLFVQGYYIPHREGTIEIGFGPAAIFDSASEESLGAGKWSLGPAMLLVHKTTDHKWTMGVLLNHLWSVAGDDDRADVSQTNVQPLLTRNLPKSWTVTLTSETSYNWEAASGERWTIPVGLTAAKVVPISRWPVSFGAGAFYNAERPDLANRWSARLSVTVVLPD